MPLAPPSSDSSDTLYRGFPDFSAWSPLLPEDVDLWSRFASSLEERRKAATPEALKASVDVAIRAAALDTGAIEGLYTVDRGFTMTVAVQGLAWEQMIGERGAEVRELFEAQLTAYEMVLDAVTHKLPVTEAWIRALHETLCAPQETYPVRTPSGGQKHELPKGQYKTQPNHVLLKDGTYHAYAPVDQVSAEIHRLVEQLRSPEFLTAHPVLQASWVHYAFVAIHPFADGNGRVARALASVYFYRCCSIPLLIFANQKFAYLEALHTADMGELRPLIGFFRDRGIDTMQLVTETLLGTTLPPPERIGQKIREHLFSWEQHESVRLENLAARLVAEIELRFSEGFGRLLLPPEVSLYFDSTDRSKLIFRIQQSFPPAVAKLMARVSILSGLAFPFRIEVEGNSDWLDVREADLSPELSDTLRLRLDAWVQRQLSRMLAEVEQQSRRPSP